MSYSAGAHSFYIQINSSVKISKHNHFRLNSFLIKINFAKSILSTVKPNTRLHIVWIQRKVEGKILEGKKGKIKLEVECSAHKNFPLTCGEKAG